MTCTVVQNKKKYSSIDYVNYLSRFYHIIHSRGQRYVVPLNKHKNKKKNKSDLMVAVKKTNSCKHTIVLNKLAQLCNQNKKKYGAHSHVHLLS